MSRIIFGIGIVSVLASVIGLGHWAVYRAVIAFWNVSDPRAILGFRIGFTVLGISFIATSILTMLGYNPLFRVAYAASAVWLGTAYWLLLASALGALLLFGSRWIGAEAYALYAGRALMLLALGVSAYGIWHSYDTKMVRYDVSLPALPDSWNGKTVALIADTHLGNVRGAGFSARIAQLVAAQRPEALLIAGDFYDGPPAEYAKLAAPFGALNLAQGTFFANGNHEEFADHAAYDDALRGVGITVLDDAVAVVDGLQIAGVNYSTTSGGRARETLGGLSLNPSLPAILIKHVPDSLDEVEDVGFDLQVSGHTHRGQIPPGMWIVKKVFGEYAYGQHDHGTLNVITTSGAGTWGPPQRVGTNGEVVLITLHAR